MLRVGSKLLAARPAALVSRVSHQTRQLTELEYKVDDAFRERMLRPERKGKRGRFYVIDPPVASEYKNSKFIDTDCILRILYKNSKFIDTVCILLISSINREHFFKPERRDNNYVL